VAEIRPKDKKDSNSESKDREEESYINKKDLVVQLCRLFNTRETTLSENVETKWSSQLL
jgi:hypothetical protein